MNLKLFPSMLIQVLRTWNKHSNFKDKSWDIFFSFFRSIRCKYRKIALICIFLLFKTTGRIYTYIFILIITQVSVAIIFMIVINGCFYDSWGSDAWRLQNVLSSVLFLMLTYHFLCSVHGKNSFKCILTRQMVNWAHYDWI